MSTSGYPLVTLVILDGWGIAPPGPGNAVELARTPVFDGLVARYPSTQLRASGAAVGCYDWAAGRLHCLALAPDGLTAAGGGDGRIVVWDLDLGDR